MKQCNLLESGMVAQPDVGTLNNNVKKSQGKSSSPICLDDNGCTTLVCTHREEHSKGACSALDIVIDRPAIYCYSVLSFWTLSSWYRLVEFNKYHCWDDTVGMPSERELSQSISCRGAIVFFLIFLPRDCRQLLSST